MACVRKKSSKYTALTAGQMFKYPRGEEPKGIPYRSGIFVKKMESGDKFQLVDGSTMTFEYDRKIATMILSWGETGYRKMNKRDKFDYGRLELIGHDGVGYCLSTFAKTKEFGGKGVGHSPGLKYEDQQIGRLNKQIQSIMETNETDNIQMTVGDVTRHIYGVKEIKSTPGVPKSDFHFMDHKGNPNIWVSYKKDRPPHFQQYGGITKPTIIKHREVQRFVEDIQDLVPSGMFEPGMLFWRPIKDSKLKSLAVYGYKFGGKYGVDNVNCLAAGDLDIIEYGDEEYELTAKYMAYNGEDIGKKLGKPWTPVLMAAYRNNRRIRVTGMEHTRWFLHPLYKVGKIHMKHVI